jgi:TonB family protein
MRRNLAVVTAFTALFAPAGAPAQPAPREFSGSSAWAMEYAEDSCRLVRDFTNGDDVITLALERFEPGDALETVMVSRTLTRNAAQPTAAVTLVPGAVQFQSQFVHIPMEDGRTYFGFGPLRLGAAIVPRGAGDVAAVQAALVEPYRRGAEIAAARQITTFAVTGGFAEDFMLDLGPMAAPIQAMQACVDDLLVKWGVDADRHRTASRLATAAQDPQTWVTEKDYPVRDRMRHRQGWTSVRVMLDAAGKPTSCHVRARAEAQAFDRTACRVLLEKGQFIPALDASGTPMPSYYVANFTFRLNFPTRS